jgi:hypothetical protein
MVVELTYTSVTRGLGITSAPDKHFMTLIYCNPTPPRLNRNILNHIRVYSNNTNVINSVLQENIVVLITQIGWQTKISLSIVFLRHVIE